MKIALVAIVLIATALILAAVVYFIRRPKPYSPENLVLRGAINSIVDGVAHPEVQRLLVPIPGLKVSKPKAATGDTTLPRAIMLRNPYVDPMSLMQVDLLARWRREGRREGPVFDALLASINGIAQGLQNTG